MDSTKPQLNSVLMTELFDRVSKKIDIHRTSIKQILPLAFSSNTIFHRFMQLLEHSVSCQSFRRSLYFDNGYLYTFDVDGLGTTLLKRFVLNTQSYVLPVPEWYKKYIPERKKPVELVVSDLTCEADLDFILSHVKCEKLHFSDYSPELDAVLFKHSEINNIHVDITDELPLLPSVQKLTLEISMRQFDEDLYEQLTPKTTHVVLNYKSYSYSENTIEALCNFFKARLHCLEIDFKLQQTSYSEYFMDSYRMLENDIANVFLEHSEKSYIGTKTLRFTYYLKIHRSTKEFIATMILQLAEQGFKLIKTECDSYEFYKNFPENFHFLIVTQNLESGYMRKAM